MSFVTLPVIGEIKTWQLTFMIVGLPGVLLALLMILTVREPERKGLKMDANGVAVKASLRIRWVLSKPIERLSSVILLASLSTP